MYTPSFMGLLTSCLSICSVTFAFPTERRVANDSSADVQTYFNLNGAAHGERSKSLTADGYRMISLSAYGTAPNANYAAVWIKRDGNPFEVIYDADESTYNSWFDSWKAKGYVSTHVSATGPAGSAVFAGVMEKVNVTNWAQLCGMKTPYAYDNATNGIPMLVKDFRMYGTPGDRRYCILGHENVGNQLSTIFYTTNYSINYAEIYSSELAKRFWRPSRLFLSDDHVITPQFVDTAVGKWVALDGLTGAELAAEIESQKAQGLYPIDLHGGVSGADVRFSVIFAEQDTPEARKWSATGSFTGFKDNDAAMAAFDSTMQTWMTKNGVRQAQIAIALNGTAIAERSYTWAESNRAVVQPDDIFLLASVSKIFVHAAVYNLIEAGKLNYSTPVYPLLGYKPVDERANEITIDHLLRHTSGYNRDKSGDPGFMFRDIAFALFNGTRAATLRDVIEYQLTRTLDFAPGTDYSYSNYGTMLASYVVSNVTGVPYLDFLKQNILGDLDVRLYETDGAKHVDDRIVQESKYTGYDPVDPDAYRLVPGPYGGDGAIKEECMGGFSLAASASTVARFIGSHAVAGTGGRAVYSERDGTVVGARSFASSRPDVDWALTLNTREYISEAEFDDLRYWKIPFTFEDVQLA
ncbi:putative penicillin-binding protein PbpX [Colletotrichum sp. SAR 10_70]|nr:putative penicillin-binding protein PbpX [Colletotrichum sp. SAR 10_65]KAI8170366.1 putative penicillin-binding protein PbpX [Colletotrichum sp. SAR 10_71]KAI8182464.1 putative penicillin-binding protein PbpX [Colletotrichum sp. SAR 10_75]KAI8194094.1 putative penicillin-binding protein PbpX [Colletotrichum sp. SAR 10_70]KAI8225489.1 putative penicillin-binding protein PbpX [Colletotrichum sp. SAR 10_77]KAJ5001083.1 putative penicillin-binding protein PbpX [Colletotrichum sp. SAR 10_66]